MSSSRIIPVPTLAVETGSVDMREFEQGWIGAKQSSTLNFTEEKWIFNPFMLY